MPRVIPESFRSHSEPLSINVKGIAIEEKMVVP